MDDDMLPIYLIKYKWMGNIFFYGGFIMINNMQEVNKLRKKLADRDQEIKEMSNKIKEMQKSYNEIKLNFSQKQREWIKFKESMNIPPNVRDMQIRIETLIANLRNEEMLRRDYEQEVRMLKTSNAELEQKIKEQHDILRAEIEIELKEIYDERKEKLMLEIDQYKKEFEKERQDLKNEIEKERRLREKAETELNDKWDI